VSVYAPMIFYTGRLGTRTQYILLVEYIVTSHVCETEIDSTSRLLCLREIRMQIHPEAKAAVNAAPFI
jgi:hypothetical protein